MHLIKATPPSRFPIPIYNYNCSNAILFVLCTCLPVCQRRTARHSQLWRMQTDAHLAPEKIQCFALFLAKINDGQMPGNMMMMMIPKKAVVVSVGPANDECGRENGKKLRPIRRVHAEIMRNDFSASRLNPQSQCNLVVFRGFSLHFGYDAQKLALLVAVAHTNTNESKRKYYRRIVECGKWKSVSFDAQPSIQRTGGERRSYEQTEAIWGFWWCAHNLWQRLSK